jgi:hypothetical protein
MRGVEARRLLILEPERRRYRLRLLHPAALGKDARAEYLTLTGEALCQYLLREDSDALVIARGPMPFLSGNKTTVGYISPLTGQPHYSFVGGRGFAELLNLGLDAIVLTGAGRPDEYVVVSGRAPRLTVEWRSAADLPSGQRSAFYWLLEHELDGKRDQGSVLTVGEGARLPHSQPGRGWPLPRRTRRRRGCLCPLRGGDGSTWSTPPMAGLVRLAGRGVLGTAREGNPAKARDLLRPFLATRRRHGDQAL